MNIDDLVLVSIDDHVVEPPDMFAGRLASKYVDDAAEGCHRRQRASTAGCTAATRPASSV